jgi:predicted ABC-type transport system involved in lysophospholipase L1 biosynthesis ATPase subunit
MPAPVVQATGINLHLKSGGEPLHILKDVDLTVEAGEVSAIVGPSGSGKTSLLMVLGGLERATAGKVVIAGKRSPANPRTSWRSSAATTSASCSRTFTSSPRCRRSRTSR